MAVFGGSLYKRLRTLQLSHPKLVSVKVFHVSNISFVNSEQREKLFRVPKNGEDLQMMSDVLMFYREDSYWLVFFAYISIYLK